MNLFEVKQKVPFTYLSLAFCFGLAANQPIFADLSACPPHVRTNSTFGKPGDLPEGRFCYKSGASKEFYVSSIKSFNPKKMPATANNIQKPGFSPNGKWIVGAVNGKLVLINIDAGTVTTTDISAKMTGFYYSSPFEEPSKSIFEIVWIENPATALSAQLVDLSGSAPVLKTKRSLGTGLTLAGNEELAVSGKHFLWDSRKWGSGGTVAYSIPNNGKGTATDDMRYPVYSTFNCAASLNWSGTWMAVNEGRLDDKSNHCIPGMLGVHSGWVIKKVMEPSDVRIKSLDWVMDPAKGAISINWAPEKIENIKARNTFSDGGTGNLEFFPNFTNNDDYIGVSMAGSIGPQVFVVDWKISKWTPLFPAGSRGDGGPVWFQGIAYPPPSTTTINKTQQSKKTIGLNWRGQLPNGINIVGKNLTK